MITVGLVKELYFIARYFDTPITSVITLGDARKTTVALSPDGIMDVMYGDERIWRERVEGDESFFGIESCDAISRIMACIDNGTSWEQYRWKPLN